MALTRKMLKAMGIDDEKIDQIIEAHTETTDALKAERDKFKEDAEKLPKVQEELNTLKKDVKDNDWKGKYDKEHSDFEAYKNDISQKETTAKVKDAYKKLLSECKVGDKQIDAVMRVTDFKDMKLDESGNLEGADKLKESITSTWSGFITTTETKGTGADNPPRDGGKPSGTSRAAELAAKHYKDLYGESKEG